jgi:hypothetical protein
LVLDDPPWIGHREKPELFQAIVRSEETFSVAQMDFEVCSAVKVTRQIIRPPKGNQL